MLFNAQQANEYQQRYLRRCRDVVEVVNLTVLRPLLKQQRDGVSKCFIYVLIFVWNFRVARERKGEGSLFCLI